MNLGTQITNLQKLAKANLPEILTGAGVVGVAVTGYLSVRAGRKAQRELDGFIQVPAMTKKERIVWEAKHTWRCYIPPVIAGASTIAAVVGGSQLLRKRAAAAAVAYAITEKAYSEYQEKVKETLGEKKEAEIQQELAQERADRQAQVVMFENMGDGTQLCVELYTMRYFRVSREVLDRAIIRINQLIVSDVYVTLDEFYDMVGLEYTSVSNKLGWDSNRPMDVVYKPIMGPGGEPTLAFDYNYVKPLAEDRTWTAPL